MDFVAELERIITAQAFSELELAAGGQIIDGRGRAGERAARGTNPNRVRRYSASALRRAVISDSMRAHMRSQRRNTRASARA